MFLRNLIRKIKLKIKKFKLKYYIKKYDVKKYKKKIEIEKTKKIIFLRQGNKIGDAVVNTIMYREIKKKYPEIKIDILCGRSNKEIFIRNPYVDEAIIYDKKKIDDLKNNNYDILINLDDLIFKSTLQIVNKVSANINIGFDKEMINQYDISIKKDEEKYHESKKCIEVLKLFNIENPKVSYDVFLREEEIKFSKNYLEQYQNNYIVCLNKYGSNKHRTLNNKNFKKIIEVLLGVSNRIVVLIVCAPDKKNEIKKFLNKNNFERVKLVEGIKNIGESSAIISMVDLIITPETSLVHIACAFKTNLLAIFRNKSTRFEWGPITENSKIILSSSKKDINFLDFKEIRNDIEFFFKKKY